MKPKDVHEQIADLVLIDVREPKEWKAGRIEGSIHIPMNEIPGRIGELDPSAEYVTICKVGMRSFDVARYLHANGLDAENLDGGLEAWVRNGFEISTPDGAPGMIV